MPAGGPFDATLCLVSAPSRSGQSDYRRFKSRHGARSWLAASLASLLLSCAEKKPSAPLAEPDAGPVCERGSANCACTTSGRCDDPLLCIAGRCLASSSEPDPPDRPLTRPPQQRPPPPSDGGPDVLDAASDSEPDVSTPPVDANPAPGEAALDASAD
jgi:hypothetical protein